MPPSIDSCISEMQRLLRACDEFYPKQIADGVITKDTANFRQNCYLAILDVLKNVKAKPIIEKAVRCSPPEIIAKTIGNLITPKQVVLIKAITTDLRLDPEELLKDIFQIPARLEEITKQAASDLIDHLKDLQKQ